MQGTVYNVHRVQLGHQALSLYTTGHECSIQLLSLAVAIDSLFIQSLEINYPMASTKEQEIEPFMELGLHQFYGEVT